MQNRIFAALSLACVFALAGCGGSSNSNTQPTPPAPAPTPTPPPAVDTAFAPFVLNLISTQTNNTALPVDINGTTFTFTEDANAFNSALAGP